MLKQAELKIEQVKRIILDAMRFLEDGESDVSTYKKLEKARALVEDIVVEISGLQEKTDIVTNRLEKIKEMAFTYGSYKVPRYDAGNALEAIRLMARESISVIKRG